MLIRRQNNSGFTIVELLIVIVVIGILAAITIVAYSGIQQRARNAKTISAVNSYLTAFQGYLAQNGSYPPVASNTMYCLGQPAASCTTATTNWIRSAPLETALQTIISTMPLPGDGPGTSSTTDSNLGCIPTRTPADYPWLNGVNSGFLVYMLEGDTPCLNGAVASGGWPTFSTAAPAGGRTYFSSTFQVSTCWIPLPAN